jgi:two-component system, OmpR family, sensor kinase
MDGLLAFSRAGGKSDDLRELGSVDEALAAVMEEHEALRAAIQAEVSVRCDPLAVACPPTLLRVLFANLVGNALKFLSGRPADKRRVSVEARKDGPFCEIAIDDSGPGITPEDQARIFEPFYRGAGSAAPGVGLGLATVRRIVEAHEGTIACRSTVGVGSTFVVRLPLAPFAVSSDRSPGRSDPAEVRVPARG